MIKKNQIIKKSLILQSCTFNDQESNCNEVENYTDIEGFKKKFLTLRHNSGHDKITEFDYPYS